MALAQKPATGLRIASLILEWFIMFVIVMIFNIPAMNHDSFGLFRITHESYKLQLFSDARVYVGMFGFSLLFLKDCINGQSIAKRLIRIQVVDKVTGNAATPLQCVLRNVSLLLLPLEALAVLAEPSRRIGDKIAGTEIVIYSPASSNKSRRPFQQYIIPVFIAYAIPVALMFLLSTVNFNKPATPFIPGSYNEAKSQALQKLLTDDFANYFTASVKYYDSVENKQFAYISVICDFKENALSDPALTTQQLEDKTIAAVRSLYADDLFHGKVQFVYREGNSMSTWNHIFGVRFTGDIE